MLCSWQYFLRKQRCKERRHPTLQGHQDARVYRSAGAPCGAVPFTTFGLEPPLWQTRRFRSFIFMSLQITVNTHSLSSTRPGSGRPSVKPSTTPRCTGRSGFARTSEAMANTRGSSKPWGQRARITYPARVYFSGLLQRTILETFGLLHHCRLHTNVRRASREHVSSAQPTLVWELHT